MPVVPWRTFEALLEHGRDGFMQGDHVTILGPTKSGKTTLALRVVEMRDYVIGLFTKPRDPIIDDLERRGWRVTRTLDIRAQSGVVIDRRIAYWPVKASGTIQEKMDWQADRIRGAMDYIFEAGHWCVFADETIWIAQHLGIRDELEAFWYQGRTSDISLVTLAQRPAWVPRAAYSQVEHLFLFHTGDRDDQKAFADIGGGVDVDLVRDVVARLERHEFLYIAPHEGTLLRSRVELDGNV